MAVRRTNRFTANVLKVMSIFTGVQVITILCGVIRTKMVAIQLGTVGVGLFSVYVSAMETIMIISSLGINTSAVRDIAVSVKAEVKAMTVKAVKCWGWILGLLAAILTVGFSPLLSRISFGDSSHTVSFMLLGIALAFSNIASVKQAVFQGLKQYRSLARMSITGAVCSLIVALALLYFMEIDAIIPILISYSVISFVVTLFFKAETGVAEPSMNLKTVFAIGRGFIVLGIYMTLSTLMTNLVAYLFTSWLNTAGSTEQTGLFQAGYTLFNRYSGIIFLAIGVEYYPRLSSVAFSKWRTNVFVNHEASLILWLIMPMMALFILFAPVIVMILYSSDFLEIVPMITFGIIGTVLRGFSWCLAYTILSRGDGRIYLTCEVSSALLYLVLNVAGYRLLGITGIGVAYIIWYVLYLALVWMIYRRRYGLYVNRRLVWLSCGILAIGLVMAGVELLTGLWWINAVIAAGVVALSARHIIALLRR